MKFISRGGIYLVHTPKGPRPMLVVSNDVANDVSPVIIVAPLTTSPSNSWTIPIYQVGDTINYVACSMVQRIDRERVIKFLHNVSKERMNAVDWMLIAALGLNEDDVEPSEMRGRIVLVTTKCASGSEQAGTRPCVVVSSSESNQDPAVTSAVVIPFTSKLTKTKLPTHVIFEKSEAMHKASIALCEQPQITYKDAWIDTRKSIATMKDINIALKVALGILPPNARRQ